jgi:diaminohydroxyphosphoribosylaminopyrimidine deaminase / 5-amino-6-(5-phosphoribosylamino)uracil reductase
MNNTTPILDADIRYMRRAMELASLGIGHVSPNPMVGCVIVHEGKIIGEGYHQQYGHLHAEPNAINEVKDPQYLQESTIYVTLEPCAHQGKTPPCADLLVKKKVKRVVIGAVDSNPLVGGKGIKKLKEAGIQVDFGVLEKELRWQNRRFFTFMERKRPYVILKWAQTEDGFVARKNYDSKWISNSISRQMVHRWRAEEAAIMVGTKTAFYDNPKLNVRGWQGKDPLRVFIDKRLELDKNYHLFDGTQDTVCYNLVKSQRAENLQYVKLKEGFSVEDILKDLYERKVQSLIVEGGSVLLQHFIRLGVWDEARMFVGPVRFEEGIPAPKMDTDPGQILEIQNDLLKIYYNRELEKVI